MACVRNALFLNQIDTEKVYHIDIYVVYKTVIHDYFLKDL